MNVEMEKKTLLGGIGLNDSRGWIFGKRGNGLDKFHPLAMADSSVKNTDLRGVRTRWVVGLYRYVRCQPRRANR